MITISIYEDRSIMRESLKLLLESVTEFKVVGLFPNCKRADEQTLELLPDVVLMDIDMPEINGIEGVKKIKNVKPETQIIMLTVFEDDDKIFDAIKAGADGYLLKNTIPQDLINAIKHTSIGGASISPGIAIKVLNAFREISVTKPKQNFDLSKREQEVLELLVKGYSYKKIAETSFVSIDTVRSHIKNIYLKLQVNSATEAVSKALKLKIVEF